MKRVAVLCLLCSGCVCGEYLSLPESDGYGMVGDSILLVGEGECSSVGILLSRMMGEKIQNNALDGAQIEHILLRYYSLDSVKPLLHTVVTNGGTNNITAGQLVEEVYDEILAYWQTILSDGHFLIHLLPYHYRGDREVLNPAVDMLDASLLVACDEMNVECIDLRDLFDAHPEYYLDTIHPTLSARDMIADQIASRHSSP